jgi:sec-independent protein translocase protein TatB
MNFLGMGPMELLLIVVLALIVFGPAKLPEIMGQVGKAIADFRRATSELSDEFNRTIQAELQETRAVVDETKATLSEAKASVYDAHASVNSAFTGVAAPARTAVPGDALPAPTNGTSGAAHLESGANGTAAVQSTPALADTSQWSWETSASPSQSTPPPEKPAAAEKTEWSWETAGPKPVSPPSEKSERAANDELLPPY